MRPIKKVNFVLFFYRSKSPSPTNEKKNGNGILKNGKSRNGSNGSPPASPPASPSAPNQQAACPDGPDARMWSGDATLESHDMSGSRDVGTPDGPSCLEGDEPEMSPPEMDDTPKTYLETASGVYYKSGLIDTGEDWNGYGDQQQQQQPPDQQVLSAALGLCEAANHSEHIIESNVEPGSFYQDDISCDYEEKVPEFGDEMCKNLNNSDTEQLVVDDWN